MYHVLPIDRLLQLESYTSNTLQRKPYFKYLIEASMFLEKFGPEKIAKGITIPDCFNRTSSWILDMGTGIGEGVKMEDYISLIKFLRPGRFVVPDVLRDKDKTLALFEKFFGVLKALDFPTVPICAVQGKTLEDFEECIKHYKERLGDFVAGIPYRCFCGDTTIEKAIQRIKTATTLAEKFNTVNFHLLGMWHVCELSLFAIPNINSCDSSFGYVMAGEGLSIFDIRPEDASIHKMYDFDPAKVFKNCDLLDDINRVFYNNNNTKCVKSNCIEEGEQRFPPPREDRIHSGAETLRSTIQEQVRAAMPGQTVTIIDDTMYANIGTACSSNSNSLNDYISTVDSNPFLERR